MPTTSTRRELLRTALATGLIPLAARIGFAADKPAPIVDTHIHCFAGKDNQKFRYHPNGPYKPAAPATPEHLLKCMDGAGVGFAIIVHPEPYQDDHAYLEHCLDVGKGRFKGTCL